MDTASRILTSRLALMPVTPQMKLAMQSSRAAFAELCGAALPEGWPEFPEAFGNPAPTPHPWHGYLFVSRSEPQLIGNGGMVAPPDTNGIVEIGYEIAPAFRGKGFATEAAQGLIDLAFANGARSVIAHTLPWPNASTAVLTKLGMHQVEPPPGPDEVWRWQIDGAQRQSGEGN